MTEAGFPVSVTGVVVRDGAVLLPHNDRDEWEPPGGRLEIGDLPMPDGYRRSIRTWFDRLRG